ncbi:MAG: DUF3883 domain-containing protein [Saprospiraceae bacterium]
MKLSILKKDDLLRAGKHIDEHGIPKANWSNQYWVVLPNSKEYPFKYLTSLAHELATGNEITFQSNESYRSYIEKLGFDIKYYSEGFDFIKKEDIELFEKNAGSKYLTENGENVRDGERLKPFIQKLNYWASQAAIEGFTSKEDNSWKWATIFKSYIWIKIFRKNDSGKVFFTVGANGNGSLFFKIDCQRLDYAKKNSKALSKVKVDLIDNYLKRAGLKKGSDNKYDGEVLIDKSELEEYNWNRLIESTRKFIIDNLAVYNDLERMATEEIIEDNKMDDLSFGEKPEMVKSKIPVKRKYSGYNSDASKQQESSKVLGDCGEKLVIAMEKKRLSGLGMFEEARMVRKELDGKGYDITSYNEKGDEIHIEVKTTCMGNDEPFYMSLNERDFFNEHPHNYFLYRLYDYNFHANSAKFFKLTPDELKSYNFSAINFEVSLIL